MKGELYFDGGCLPKNPGGVPTWGFVLRAGGREHRGHGVVRGAAPATNNVAEYHGLLRGLRKALDLGVTHLEIRGDSQLVIRQLQGPYRVRAPHLVPLHGEARRLLTGVPRWDADWVPRERNADADAETRLAYDQFLRRGSPGLP